MGRDKATIVVGGETLAARSARLLSGVAAPCIEVGPGVSGLPAVTEQPPGSGPLAALAAGVAALAPGAPALVVACDLPSLDVELLRWLAGHPGAGSVVPVTDRRPQPLCARWSAADLAVATGLVAEGARSMQELVRRSGALLVAPPDGLVAALADVDTPEQLAQLRGIHSE
jgi:molybdopterin-guanine dinucleotide biosynthesis protein A